MELLCSCPDPRRSARISCGNLAIVRHCASQGRLRRPAAQAVLEPALARMSTRGWRSTWQAIRRRLNVASDAAATEALLEHGPHLSALGKLLAQSGWLYDGFLSELARLFVRVARGS